MQRGEMVKSKSPRRWMLILLAFLLAGGVAAALFWSEQSNAQGVPSLSESALTWNASDHLKCEMVRIWPLPADCVFVFRP